MVFYDTFMYISLDKFGQPFVWTGMNDNGVTEASDNRR